MHRRHKVKAPTWMPYEKFEKAIKLAYEWKTVGRTALFTCHRSGVDPRKMPVDPACGFPQTGGYELTSWSPLLQKNQRATRRTHESHCKNKRAKWGWPPLVHSVPDVLVRHVVNAFQASLLRVRQHNVPNGIADIAQTIGNAEPQAVHRVGINLQRNIPERGCGFQPLVRTRCGPSPICCTGAPEAHPGPFEGPHCPR